MDREKKKSVVIALPVEITAVVIDEPRSVDEPSAANLINDIADFTQAIIDESLEEPELEEQAAAIEERYRLTNDDICAMYTNDWCC